MRISGKYDRILSDFIGFCRIPMLSRSESDHKIDWLGYKSLSTNLDEYFFFGSNLLECSFVQCIDVRCRKESFIYYIRVYLLHDFWPFSFLSQVIFKCEQTGFCCYHCQLFAIVIGIYSISWIVKDFHSYLRFAYTIELEISMKILRLYIFVLVSMRCGYCYYLLLYWRNMLVKVKMKFCEDRIWRSKTLFIFASGIFTSIKENRWTLTLNN